MRTNRVVVFPLLILLFIILYLFTFSPSMDWRDAPEFVVVANELGIAHPAGSPLYACVGKIFTFIPLGTIEMRVVMLSVVSGGVGIGLLYLLLWYVLKGMGCTAPTLPAVVSCVFLGASPDYWKGVTVTEVYPLQYAGIVAAGLCLVLWWRKKEVRYACLALFILALTVGVHVTTGFYLFATLLFIYTYRQRNTPRKTLIVYLLLLSLGGSIYFYLPVRSYTNPYYDWGNPETVHNIFYHVTDRKDKGIRMRYRGVGELGRQIHHYFDLLYEDFGAIGMGLTVVGFYWMMTEQTKLCVLLFFYFFSEWWFYIVSWKEPVHYVPSYMFWCVLLSVGVWQVGKVWSGTREHHNAKPQRK